MAHSKGQKDKIRKSGLSLQNKTVKLGQHCGIFSALIYWNPTHQRMETVMHLPPGQTLPDVNKLLHRSAIDDARSPAARRAAQPSDFHHDIIAEGDSNADATTDIENEAGYNCAQGHTADIGLPSIHVIPDEEDGAMVAPHENRGQRRPFQQEQRGAYRPAVGRPPSSSGSSVTMDNEDHVAAANGHAHDRMDAFLQADIRRNHQRPRWPARALFSTRPTKERRVALDRAGGTSRQYVAAGLRRRDGGLRRAPIGDAEGSRMQRDSLAGKFLGLLDELASRMDTARA